MCIADLTIPYTSKNRFLVDVGDDAQNGVDKDVMRVTFVEAEAISAFPSRARRRTLAASLGVSFFTLQSWRSKGSPSGPPVTRIDRIVLYSMKGLERLMEQRTVQGR
jgi:hypothetical protein